MKVKHKGYIIKVSFWGDSITPMYKYKLYEPREYWFPKLVWVEDIHRSKIKGKLSDRLDSIIANYQKELGRWN